MSASESRGSSITEAAYQKALEFAHVRKQGREPGLTEDAVIVEHPDVRRMLLTMRAYKEAIRGLLYINARQVDLERHAESTEERESRRGAQSPCSRRSPKPGRPTSESKWLRVGIQVHGGMGFIEETGAAQFYRDIRIAPIYEGTNGIQSIDLVTRKLGMRHGQVAKEFFELIEADVAEAPEGARRSGRSAPRAPYRACELPPTISSRPAIPTRCWPVPLPI